MANEKIEVEIVLDDGSVRKGFANIQKDAKDTGKEVEKSFGKGFANLGKTLLKVGAAAGAAAVAISGVIVARGIAAAKEQEDAVNKLNTALRLTGKFSLEASKDFQLFAAELQKVTRVGDEATLEIGGLIQSLGNLDQEGLKRATKAAVDLSSALGIDLNAAALLVGKAAAGEVSSFSRYGLIIRKAATETETFARALDAIEGKFGGAAELEVKTFSGSVDQLSNSFGDFLEEIGNFFIKSPALITLINEISKVIISVSETISKASVGNSFIKDLIIDFSVLTQAGVETGRRIGLSFELAYARATQAWLAFKVATTLGLSDTFNKELDDILIKIDELKNSFEEDSETTKFFDDLIMKINETKNAIAPSEEQSIGEQTKAELLTVGEGFEQFAEGFTDQMEALVKNADKGFKAIGKSAVQGLANGVGGAFAAFGKAIVSGENALQAFLNTLVAAMGQMAIQLGTQFLLQGIAYTWAGLPNGPALIAAGAALATFGGVLSAVGGGGGASATAGGATDNFTPEIAPEDTAAEAIDEQQLISQTGVTINVEGTVIDPKSTGATIAETLQEYFDASGGQLVVRA